MIIKAAATPIGQSRRCKEETSARTLPKRFSAKNLEEAKALSASSNPDDLSKALEKIKTAQETLLQINSLISQ